MKRSKVQKHNQAAVNRHSKGEQVINPDSKHQQSGMKNPVSGLKSAKPESWKYYGALALVVLISFVVFSPVLHNSLLNWDDDIYITNNPLIHSFLLKEIFSQYVSGNYHPVTILAIATQYHFFGLNPTGYHAVNLLLHLLNVILVFYSVFLLSDKMGVALIASLLFGIHPLHVESVAWAAELKDLLYTFFFLMSYIFYLKYTKTSKTIFYIIALLVFSVSLLSKAMAASLPVLLLLTDYFKGRKINIKIILEKVPFFVLALFFGIVALLAQKSAGAVQDAVISLPQGIVFASYGFITYLLKLVIPFQLSAFYPYPALVRGSIVIPGQYYVYLLLILILTSYIIYSLRFSKKIFFGFGFFAVTVFLVLQLWPVGGTIMADRYTYIPSIGIFYLAGEGLYLLWNKKKLKWITVILLSVFTIFYSVKTYARCSVWNNDLTLWNDVISQHKTVVMAYYKRGVYLFNEKKYDEALADFNKSIEMNKTFAAAFYFRGEIFIHKEKYDRALDDFNKTLELNPNTISAYYNRGLAFMNEKMPDKALQDFNKTIELNKNYTSAYYSRGVVYMNEKNYEKALEDFNKTNELDKNYIEAYVNRGNILREINRHEEALKDYDKAIELKPDFAIIYNNRGILFYKEKRYEEAIANYSKAISLKTDYPQAIFNRGLAEFYSGKKDAACLDMKQAAALGYQPAIAAQTQICK
jgi:protein O-mannosyl-transferase